MNEHQAGISKIEGAESANSEIQAIEQGIAAIEAQRELLGEAVVDAMLAPIRERLAALRAAVQSTPAQEQRKQVTILFASVSGFSALGEKTDVEAVHDRLNTLWEILDRVLIEHRGMIDKHIGDTVMAIFGAAEAREDDPERAVRAALEMQRQIQEFSLAHPQNTALHIRIGLNTGPVILGEVGSQREFTALGDTVNLAARLEQAAPAGDVLIAHDTYRQVRGLFEVQAQPLLAVKGKTEPVQTYLVLRAKPHAFRLPTRGVEGVETRMIGRSAELQRLQAALAIVVERRKLQAALVVGEAGVGKSRLLHEFNRWAKAQPGVWRTFKGRAYEATRQQPYALLRDLFAFRFGILESDPLAVARTKFEAGITSFMAADSDARLKAHFLGHILGFDFSASPHLSGILHDAPQIRDRALHYLSQFFSAAGQADGLKAIVVLLEDIHWADDASLEALAHLRQNGQDLPMLLLALARPSLFERRLEGTEWREAAERIDLQPLSPHESSQLVNEILKRAADVPPSLSQTVVSRAEGNPFYVEELIKMLIDAGAILPGAEEWRVIPERLSAVTIPPTLTGILQTRLEGLSAAERQTLQCASVMGRVFWDRAVQFLQQGAEQIEGSSIFGQVFQALQRRELVFERETSAFAGSNEYIFKHALLHDVTYETVLKRLRRKYHALAAVWIIEMSGDRADEYAGAIAGHYECAQAYQQAAEWYARAGAGAAAAYASETAINHYRTALEFAPQGHLSDAWKVDLYLKLGAVLDLLGRFEEAEAYELKALTLAEQSGNRALVPACQQALGQVYIQRGDYAIALTWLKQAQAGWQAVGDLARLSQTLERIGFTCCFQGEYDLARSYLLESLALGQTPGGADPRTVAQALEDLGIIAWRQGDFSKDWAYQEESLALRRAIGDKRGIADNLNNLASTAVGQNDLATAQSLFEECLAIRREIGHTWGISVSLNNLGNVAFLLGDFGAARKYLEESLRLSRQLGNKVILATSLLNLGVMALSERDWLAAQSRYAESLPVVQKLGERILIAYNLLGWAALAIEAGSPDAAFAWRAARLATSAAALASASGAVLEVIERGIYERTLAAARAALGEVAFAAACAEGETLTLEQVWAETNAFLDAGRRTVPEQGRDGSPDGDYALPVGI